MKHAIYLISILLLSSCFGQSKDKKEIKNTIDNEDLVAKYQQQKHRLEFKEHRLFYNNIEVKIDQPLAYYKKIFGKDYREFRDGDVVAYNTVPIFLNTGMDSIIGNIRIELYFHSQKDKNNYDKGAQYSMSSNVLNEEYILIDGIAVNKNTTMEYLNRQLIAKKKAPFSLKIKGTNTYEKQFSSGFHEYEEYIYISKGKLSEVSYITYGKWGD